MDLIKTHFEFRSKHNRYFGQPRVRSRVFQYQPPIQSVIMLLR